MTNPIGWCLVDLSGPSLAQPGHDLLSPELAGATPEQLGDLSWHGLPSHAYWRCVEEPAPHDPETQQLGDTPSYEVDAANHRVIARRPLLARAETLAEEAERIEVANLTLGLAVARTAAIAANNAAAGRAREAYLTAVPGQETTYAAKQAEVTRWGAAGRPADASPTSYPWAGDRAALRSVTVAEVLAEWEAVTAAWELVGRQIEAERERVNRLIDAAADQPGIQAAQASAAYPSPNPS